MNAKVARAAIHHVLNPYTQIKMEPKRIMCRDLRATSLGMVINLRTTKTSATQIAKYAINRLKPLTNSWYINYSSCSAGSLQLYREAAPHARIPHQESLPAPADTTARKYW